MTLSLNHWLCILHCLLAKSPKKTGGGNAHTHKMHSKITSVTLHYKHCVKSAKPSRIPTWLHFWLTNYSSNDQRAWLTKAILKTLLVLYRVTHMLLNWSPKQQPWFFIEALGCLLEVNCNKWPSNHGNYHLVIMAVGSHNHVYFIVSCFSMNQVSSISVWDSSSFWDDLTCSVMCPHLISLAGCGVLVKKVNGMEKSKNT